MKKYLFLFLLFTSLSVHAASYPPGYRWQTLETTHFLIHFHQGEEELAVRAASIAERVHTRITPILRHEPKEKTHLILTDHVDVANGSASQFPYNRIEVYISAPGADPASSLEYYDSWLTLVITHEYAHILHLDQARGIWGGLRRVFGRHPAAFPNQYSPLWMIEGIATLIESEATDSGRVKGTFVDMVLRTAAVENQWFDEPRAGGLTASWPGGSARYLYGSKFLSWLTRKYGIAKLADFFEDYSGNVIPYRLNASAEAVFGRDMAALYADWSAEQQSLYRAEHERLARAGFSTRRRLTDRGFESKYPIVSPDGRRIVYGHEGPFEWPTLRVIDAEDGRELHTTRVNSIGSLGWSPDGSSVAFAQLDYHGSFSILADLYIWQVGGRTRRITKGARLKDPVFTPGGRSLVAVENRGGRNRIVEVDLATGAIQPLIVPDGFMQFSEPQVSADGDRIAVAEWREGRIDVAIYSREGSRLSEITTSLQRSTNASPRFSRDGKTVYFSSDVTGVSNIYSAAAGDPTAPGSIQRITNVSGGAFYPSVGSEGRIYFADYHAGGFDIVVLEDTQTFSIEPRALPTLLDATGDDQAPASIDVPVRPYSPWRALIPRWWMPSFAVSENEFRFGASTSGADPLALHNYTISFFDNDYALAYTYDRLAATLTAAILGYEQDVEGVRFGRGGDVVPYSERTERIVVQATMPYRRVRHQTYGTLGVIRDRISTESGIARNVLAEAGIFTGTLQGIRAGALFDSAREFGFSISPENGLIGSIDYENLAGNLGSDASLQQWRAELRGYRSLPLRRSILGRHVLAARVAAGRTTGNFVLQREMEVGGVGFGELLSLDLTDFPVRGYDEGRLRGQNAALVSLEYRFPIWQIEKGPSTWPIFFHRLLGDLFIDAGTAWNTRAISLPRVIRTPSSAFDRDRAIRSAGAEIAADIVLGYYAPLRIRFGVAVPFDDDGVQFFGSVGSSF